KPFAEHRHRVLMCFWILIARIESRKEVPVPRQIPDNMIIQSFSALEAGPLSHLPSVPRQRTARVIANKVVKASYATSQSSFKVRRNCRQVPDSLFRGHRRRQITACLGRLDVRMGAPQKIGTSVKELQSHLPTSRIAGRKVDPMGGIRECH